MPNRFTNMVSLVSRCYHGVPLTFVKINKQILTFWDKHILPEIAKDPCRADNWWSWNTVLRRETILAKALGQEPETVAVVVEDAARNLAVPVGLLLIAKKYKIVRGKGTYIFVWYLSSAPRTAVDKILPHNLRPKGIGKILLETSIVFSINNRYDGRILLHAAKPVSQCTDYLPSWYSNFGLLNVPQNKKNITLARKNDSRYYYSSKSVALSISQAHDKFR